jgi:hypothetical protein
MTRAYYSALISDFLCASTEEIMGALSLNNDYALIQTQRVRGLLKLRYFALR